MFIPVGAALVLFTSIAVALIAYGGLSKQVEINTKDIAAIRDSLRDVPTRVEYNALKDSVDKVEAGVTKLTDKIDKFLQK